MVEHPIEVEVAPDLVCRQTVELVSNGSSAEQIRRTPFDLTTARTAQREVKPAVLDEPMHFVEKRRHLLDLVDDDLAPRLSVPGLGRVSRRLNMNFNIS